MSTKRHARVAAVVVVGFLAVASLASAPPASAVAVDRGAYVALTPKVVLDDTVSAGENRTFAAPGIPPGAVAWGTVSVTTPTTAGTITVQTPGGDSQPVPTLTFAAGQAATNTAVVPTDREGSLEVVNTATTGVHTRVVLRGYTRGGTATRAGMYAPVRPYVAATTRLAYPTYKADVPVAGRDGVPVDAVGFQN